MDGSEPATPAAPVTHANPRDNSLLRLTPSNAKKRSALARGRFAQACFSSPGELVVCGSYSGWKSASVFPSGSFNQADLPMPGVVAT